MTGTGSRQLSVKEALKQMRFDFEPEPLDENNLDYYVDLNTIRGFHFRRELEKSMEDATGKWVHLLFSGHRGNGKTTEILAFMRDYSHGPCFFVYRDVWSSLADGVKDYTDLLLYMAQSAVEAVLQAGVPLSDKILAPIEDWFKSNTLVEKDYQRMELSLKTEARAGVAIPGFLKLLASLTSRITGGHHSVSEVRQVLRKRVSELIGKMNQLFDLLGEQLEKQGKPPHLVLVLDSLDRYQPEKINQAFSVFAETFHQLRVHLIINLPPGIFYTAEGYRLRDAGFTIMKVPIPKIRQKHQPMEELWDQGAAVFEQIVTKRLDINKTFAGSPMKRRENLRRLIWASGGSLRDLMHLMRAVAYEAWDLPIGRLHVEAAIRRVCIDATSYTLNYEDMAVLFQIHEFKRIDRNDVGARLLHLRLALEYRNGDEWADIHPLVYESSLFNDPKIRSKFGAGPATN